MKPNMAAIAEYKKKVCMTCTSITDEDVIIACRFVQDIHVQLCHLDSYVLLPHSKDFATKLTFRKIKIFRPNLDFSLKTILSL